jgi:amidase
MLLSSLESTQTPPNKQASTRVHAFASDAMGDDDAVAIAARIRAGDVSAAEICAAAIARAEKVNPQINAIQTACFAAAKQDSARINADFLHARPHDVFAGVPTLIKDNRDVRALPTGHGTDAINPWPAKETDEFAAQYLAQGFVVLGKSSMPEFGLNASTEYLRRAPTRNPWNTDYSSGASSGGAAALVAAGVVPIAHANDGGGSIRIPAACCGLVGLKPTRDRLINSASVRTLPLNIVSEGVVSRSVRDTAQFFAGMERVYQNPKLKPIGNVTDPTRERLRIGVMIDSINGHATDRETRQTVLDTAQRLEGLGHHVSLYTLPIKPVFSDDFTLYWGMLSYCVSSQGKSIIAPDFDANQLDALTSGLARHFSQRFYKLPPALYRLRKSIADYAAAFKDIDIILSPVLAQTTPLLGQLSPDQPFEQLFARLLQYVSFTPLNNTAGSPAISLPVGQSALGLPIGIQLSANHGEEARLLALALQMEQAMPWRKIHD